MELIIRSGCATTGVAELIGQRRRWLNGSFAASVYALVHFFRFYKSGHNPFRLFMFHIQALFNAFQLLFGWFALANLWLTFTIIIDLVPSGENPTYFFGTKEITHWVNLGLTWLYGATLAMQFILALGNRPKGEVYSYVASFVIFAVSGMFPSDSRQQRFADMSLHRNAYRFWVITLLCAQSGSPSRPSR